MDKFAVDLDKVLDEFEKSEEQNTGPWMGSSSTSLISQSSQSSLTTFIHNLDPVASQPTHSKDTSSSALLSPSFESLFVNPSRTEDLFPHENAQSVSLSNGHISLPPSEALILNETIDVNKDVSSTIKKVKMDISPLPADSSLPSIGPEGPVGKNLSHKYSATLEANVAISSQISPDFQNDVSVNLEENTQPSQIKDGHKKAKGEISVNSNPSQEFMGDNSLIKTTPSHNISHSEKDLSSENFDHIMEVPSDVVESSSSENILNISYSPNSLITSDSNILPPKSIDTISDLNNSRKSVVSQPLVEDERTHDESDSHSFQKDFITMPEDVYSGSSSQDILSDNLSKYETIPDKKEPSNVEGASTNDFDFIEASSPPLIQARHGKLIAGSLPPVSEVDPSKNYDFDPKHIETSCIEGTIAKDESLKSESQAVSNLEDDTSEIREHTLIISKSKDKLCKEEWRPEIGPNDQYGDPLEQGDQPVGFHKFHKEDLSPESMAELENYLSSEENSHFKNTDCHEEGSKIIIAATDDKEHTEFNESNLEDDQGKSANLSCMPEDSSQSEEESSPDSSTDLSSPVKEPSTESIGNDVNEPAQVPSLQPFLCNGIATRMETPSMLSRPTFLDIPREPQVEIHQLGRVKPVWVPDADAPNCMLCNAKFTVIKRRHHCRTCGKVLCSQCCNQRIKLEFLQNKEGRVCHPCFLLLSEGPSTVEVSGGINSPGMTPYHGWSPNPNHPQEYCSTLPPHQQVENQPPPTVMVPVGVLKNSSSNVNTRGSQNHLEPKQVMFSDGIRPGGDLQDMTVGAPPSPRGPVGRPASVISSPPGDQVPIRLTIKGRRTIVSDDEGSLPPLILPPDAPDNFKPQTDELISYLKDKKSKPLRFALTKNLHVDVKLVTLSCCVGSECWNFASRGLCAVGQDEVLLLLEKKQGEEERVIPRCAFRLLHRLWDDAQRGQPASDLGHVLFPEGLFGSREHSGFLLVRPTFQCLANLWPPPTPFLLALLLQRWEVPWAKVFPLRLMLRLGSEARYYPCPIVSQRDRRPVYGEVGHTILSVLADLRNFQFTLPTVPGVTVHMNSGGTTTVRLPRNRWEAVRRWLVAANEHVLALGANFSTLADSHLVCVQREEDGSYHTQAINIQNTPRKVTGASFIVFSGALKVSSNAVNSTTDSSSPKIYPAKCSLVEDGLLVQMSSETLGALRAALRDMRDFTLTCGTGGPDNSETVDLVWVENDLAVNVGVRSPIDGKSLAGVESVRIHTATDYMAHRLAIRWTEVFFCREEDESALPPPASRSEEPLDPGRVAEAAAEAFCRAVTPHLPALASVARGVGTNRVGLRLSLGGELVEFEAGANFRPLPASILPALDAALIPLIHSSGGPPLVLELHFHLLYK